MAFWGVELKPDKVAPFVPPPEAVDGKLHISQVGRIMLDVSRVAGDLEQGPITFTTMQGVFTHDYLPKPSLCSASAVFGPLFKRHSTAEVRTGGWCRRPSLGMPQPAAAQC